MARCSCLSAAWSHLVSTRSFIDEHCEQWFTLSWRCSIADAVFSSPAHLVSDSAAMVIGISEIRARECPFPSSPFFESTESPALPEVFSW
jgi:hypothetical protein